MKAKEFPEPDPGELDSGNIEGYLLRIGFKESRLARAKQAFAWNIQKLHTFSHFLSELQIQVHLFHHSPPPLSGKPSGTFSHSFLLLFLFISFLKAREFSKEATKELLQRDDLSEDEDAGDTSLKLLPKKTQKDEYVPTAKPAEAAAEVFSESLDYQAQGDAALGGK